MPEFSYRVDDRGAITFNVTGHVYRVQPVTRGRSVVTVERDGEVQASDRLDLATAKARHSFAAQFNGRADVVEKELLALLKILADAPDTADADFRSDSEDDNERLRGSQATVLVALVIEAGVELFHDLNGEPYATIEVDGHHQTSRVRDKLFRNWASKLFYDRTAKVPGSQATQDALNVLSGKAIYEGPMLPVWVRLAEHDGRLYLDLGDDQWHAVEITASGWRVVPSAEVPVKFRRPQGMLPLPDPDPAGSLSALTPFVNVAEPDDLVLIVGWLLGTFNLTGGRAVLELTGEQGSAKSTLARLLRRIGDPCTVPLRTTPRDERDLVIAASNGLIVAYDNLSDIRDWLSDAFCRLSTGGGIGGRQLYTDLDEVVLDAQRPCILTGINAIATRGDLIDRTLAVTLAPIPAEQRRTEAEIMAAFEAAHPAILGGLLHAVTAALKHRDQINLPRKPRLADFVAFVEAAAPALGWEPGEFVAAFEASRRDADAVAIEALPVGPALLHFMRDQDEWHGTASALLVELTTIAGDETKGNREWPKQGHRLSGMLRRLAPSLRQVGLWVGWERSGSAGTRTIILTKNNDVWQRQQRQQRQSPAETPPNNVEFPDSAEWVEQRQSASVFDHESAETDATDATDARLPTNSHETSPAKCCVCGTDLPPDRKLLCAACSETEAA